MKIAIIAPSPVPFQIGGVEKFAVGLQDAFLKNTNHLTELIKLPVDERTFGKTLKAYRSFSKLNLDHFDLVISLKYPAWMVKHRNHICYMTHRLRGVYDCFPGEINPKRYIRELPQANKLGGIYMRKIIHYLDNKALSSQRIKHFLCISETVKKRLEYFPNQAPVKVVYPFSTLSGFNSKQGKYFLTVSRLDSAKRIDLIIKAFKKIKGDTKLLIAGTGPLEDYLKDIAKTDNRIEFQGFISDRHLIDLYASAIAVVFIPAHEDLGLITIEAMKSKKPVITAKDSGGSLEFVKDGYNGMIIDDENDLAKSIQKFVDDKELSSRLGENAYKTVSGITWEETIKQILMVAE